MIKNAILNFKENADEKIKIYSYLVMGLLEALLPYSDIFFCFDAIELD